MITSDSNFDISVLTYNNRNYIKPTKKGQTIHNEARDMAKRVPATCDEVNKSELFHPLTITEATTHATDYVGVAEKSVSRI